jgi:Asp-tRNA(Asn)/Glu-tRNA(Gln) amidotransferase A subunit family amidase
MDPIPSMGEHARGFIDFGSSFNETDYADAQQRRVEIHDAYMAMFRRNRSSIMVTPTLGCEAFKHGTIHPLSLGSREISYPWLDWAGFLYDANLTGMPACSIPMGTGDEDMPLSLQVTGPPGSDLEVLDVAETIESLLDWHQPEIHPHQFSAVEATSYVSA